MDDSEVGDNIEVIEVTPRSKKSDHSQDTRSSSGDKRKSQYQFTDQSHSRIEHSAPQFLPRSDGKRAEMLADLDHSDIDDSPSKQPSSKERPSVGHLHESGSPLIVRLKSQKLSFGQPDTTLGSSQIGSGGIMTSGNSETIQQDHTQEEIEKKLQRFLSETRDGHAMTVRWLLYDARRDNKRPQPVWQDKESPFASLQPVQIQQGESAPPGTTELRMETLVCLTHGIISNWC